MPRAVTTPVPHSWSEPLCRHGARAGVFAFGVDVREMFGKMLALAKGEGNPHFFSAKEKRTWRESPASIFRTKSGSRSG